MSGTSVRTKVFVLFSIASLLTVMPVLVLISQAVERRVYERASQELLAGSEAMRVYWGGQDTGLQETARRIAALPRVAEQLRDADTTALARSLRQEVVQRLVIVALDSNWGTVVGPALDSATVEMGEQGNAVIA